MIINNKKWIKILAVIGMMVTITTGCGSKETTFEDVSFKEITLKAETKLEEILETVSLWIEDVLGGEGDENTAELPTLEEVKVAANDIISQVILPESNEAQEVVVEENDNLNQETEEQQEGITTDEYEVTQLDVIKYAKSSVNVRTGPGTSYEKIGTLTLNQQVTVTGQAKTGWYRIDYNGVTAFVSDHYLVDTPVEIVTENQSDGGSENASTSQSATTDSTTQNSQNLSETASFQQAYAARMLELVNADRVANGLNPVTTTPELMNAAAKRAEEAYSYFSHTRPDGTTCFTVLEQYGVSYLSAGENIAWGQTSPENVEVDWMQSQGHRENILTAEYNHVGLACYVGPDGIMSWSQLFTD